MQKSWYFSQKIGVICDVTREPNIADTIYYCKKKIVKARALYKPEAHINLGTTATLSIRQRPTSSASCIARLHFLRWGSIPFSSRLPSSDHQWSTRGPRNCCTVHTPRTWGQTVCRMHIWLVKAEHLIRSWVALRLYVQPIRILFLILMNVMEVKVRINDIRRH